MQKIDIETKIINIDIEIMKYKKLISATEKVKVKIKVGPLIKCHIYCNSTSRAPALTARIPRVVACAFGCISHT